LERLSKRPKEVGKINEDQIPRQREQCKRDEGERAKRQGGDRPPARRLRR
jgi:hypothetical protein